MNKDDPETIAMDETQWAHTQVDDVFQPSVRVQLAWKDVEAAVENGAVVPQQAHALWAAWAAPSSRLRVAASAAAPRTDTDFVPTQTDLAPDQPPLATRRGLPGAGTLLGLALGLVLGAAGAWLLCSA